MFRENILTRKNENSHSMNTQNNRQLTEMIGRFKLHLTIGVQLRIDVLSTLRREVNKDGRMEPKSQIFNCFFDGGIKEE